MAALNPFYQLSLISHLMWFYIFEIGLQLSVLLFLLLINPMIIFTINHLFISVSLFDVMSLNFPTYSQKWQSQADNFYI